MYYKGFTIQRHRYGFYELYRNGQYASFAVLASMLAVKNVIDTYNKRTVT